MNNFNSMTYGNLALKSSDARPAFQVIDGNLQSYARDSVGLDSSFSARARLNIGAALVVAVALIALSLTFFNAFSAQRVFDSATANTPQTVVSVHEGDTLWDIAAAHPVSDLSTSDTVSLIRSWNGLSSSELSIGMDLLVPASSH